MTEDLDVEDRRESEEGGRRETDDFREAVKKVASELKWLGVIIAAGGTIWAAGIATAIGWAEWHNLPQKLVAQDSLHMQAIESNRRDVSRILDATEKLIENDAQGARNDAYLFCVVGGQPPRVCADRLIDESGS